MGGFAAIISTQISFRFAFTRVIILNSQARGRCLIMSTLLLDVLCVAILICSLIHLIAGTALVYLGSIFLNIHAMDSINFLSWLYKVGSSC